MPRKKREKPDARRPSSTHAFEFKCHDCQGHYVDGKKDCECPRCSLYYWMPYRAQVPNYDWENFAPKAVGLVLRESRKREMTPEQIAAMQAGRERAQAAKAAKAPNPVPYADDNPASWNAPQNPDILQDVQQGAQMVAEAQPDPYSGIAAANTVTPAPAAIDPDKGW